MTLTYDEAMAALEAAGTEQTRKSYLRHGASEPLFGVKFGDLRPLGKKIGVVLTYGEVDPYSSGAVNAIRMFQDIFRFIPAEIVDIVYGEATDEGEIKENAEVMKRAFDLGTKLAAE